MKIKELPVEVRPREKAMKYGFDALSDVELVAIILGYGTKNCNALELASNVLMSAGGLNGLLRSNYQSLVKVSGIKEAKALQLASLITIYQRVDINEDTYLDYSIKQIVEKYQKRLLIDKQEKVVLLTLNRNGEVIKESIIGIGADSSVHISVREVFKEVYINNGYGFYLLHTHPTSISYPSDSDIRQTNLMLAKSKKLGLHFVDHYIIGIDGYTSINEFLKKKYN